MTRRSLSLARSARLRCGRVGGRACGRRPDDDVCRWVGKTSLVMTALMERHSQSVPPPPDTGVLLSDLVVMLVEVREGLRTPWIAACSGAPFRRWGRVARGSRRALARALSRGAGNLHPRLGWASCPPTLIWIDWSKRFRSAVISAASSSASALAMGSWSRPRTWSSTAPAAAHTPARRWLGSTVHCPWRVEPVGLVTLSSTPWSEPDGVTRSPRVS